MADFFQTLQSVVRLNQGDERASVPGYLQTHPLTLTRISEARERASKLEPTIASTASITPGTNPLLPPSLQIATGARGQQGQGATGDFGWARERLRVLSASTAALAIREYQQMKDKQPLDDHQRYGLALAHQLAGQHTEALRELTPLAQHSNNLWVQIAMGEAEARSGQYANADKRFESLLARMPTHRALALSYAKLLGERNTAAAGTRAVAVLRPLLSNAGTDLPFQQIYARAYEVAGDPVRAGEAWAEAAFLSGRPEQALVQLNNLKKRDDLDYYARTRIDARISTITPTVLELRRQGIRDNEVNPRAAFSITP